MVGNEDAVSGDDLGELRGEDGRAGADEFIAKDDFLLAIEALGLDEIELAAAEEGASAGELDRGERALVDLSFVVFDELLRGAKRLLLDDDVFAERDQVEVEARGAVDGLEDLLFEEEARGFAIVAGDMRR